MQLPCAQIDCEEVLEGLPEFASQKKRSTSLTSNQATFYNNFTTCLAALIKGVE